MFDAGISPDPKTPLRYAVGVDQGGLTLPDRDYYLQASFAPQKAKFQAYVAKMLGMIGWPDADANAAAIVALETAIAEASWSRAEERDPVKTYNPMSPAELATLAPGFDWTAYLDAGELPGVNRVVIGSEYRLSEDRRHLRGDAGRDPAGVGGVHSWSTRPRPYLSKRFADAHFDFHNKTLSASWSRSRAGSAPRRR